MVQGFIVDNSPPPPGAMNSTPLSIALYESGFFTPWRSRPSAPTVRDSPAYKVKVEVIERTLSEAQRILSQIGLNAHPDVEKALCLIHRRLFDPSLNADVVYSSISSSTFRLRFLKEVQTTVRAYIENARLLVSARLLTYPEIDIYLIADAVGYAHYGTYFRAFRRHFDCAPSEYREIFLFAPDHVPYAMQEIDTR